MHLSKLKISFLVLSLFIFTGCFGNDSIGKDDADLTSIEGILKLQESNDDFAGTHVLIQEDKEKIPVRSLKINLSDKNYLGNMVKATGFMGEDEVFQIESLKVQEVIKESDEEGELTEYSNGELGFKWHYFDDWMVDESSSKVTFEAPNGSKVEINSIPFAYSGRSDENGDAMVPLESYFATESTIDDIRPLMNKIGPDKLDAVKLEREDGGYEYYLYRAGSIYQITFLPSAEKPTESEGESIDHEAIFSDMVSDFQFTPKSSTEDAADLDEVGSSDEYVEYEPEADSDFNLTATFESLPYHFSGNYPSDWYYAGKKSDASGVLHHYGFSDEVIEDDSEVLRLDVLTNTDLPAGKTLTVNGKELVVVENDGNIEIYTLVEDRAYRVQGPEDYKDLMIEMTSSIHPLEADEQGLE